MQYFSFLWKPTQAMIAANLINWQDALWIFLFFVWLIKIMGTNAFGDYVNWLR